ncbi:MAG: leucine-rich repeat domain-containing protein, partial [Clostridiales bacterium]|nr:leucine-rich repeat domain-containing protein [Clostridiales bacterium]
LATPNGATSISYAAFEGCGSIISIEIPASVTSFGSFAFTDMPNLEQVTLKEGLTTLGDNGSLFLNCAKLKNVTLPSSLRTIGNDAFSYTGIESIVIPEGITELTEGIFDGCKKLNSVTLPSTLTTIGASAFLDCTALASISIPASVTTVGSSAFSGCTALVSVVFERDENNDCELTTFGNNVFQGCTALTEIVLPSSLSKLGLMCFYGWTEEQTIKMDGFGGPMFEWNINWYGTSKAVVVWNWVKPETAD